MAFILLKHNPFGNSPTGNQLMQILWVVLQIEGLMVLAVNFIVRVILHCLLVEGVVIGSHQGHIFWIPFPCLSLTPSWFGWTDWLLGTSFTGRLWIDSNVFDLRPFPVLVIILLIIVMSTLAASTGPTMSMLDALGYVVDVSIYLLVIILSQKSPRWSASSSTKGVTHIEVSTSIWGSAWGSCGDQWDNPADKLLEVLVPWPAPEGWTAKPGPGQRSELVETKLTLSGGYLPDETGGHKPVQEGEG